MSDTIHAADLMPQHRSASRIIAHTDGRGGFMFVCTVCRSDEHGIDGQCQPCARAIVAQYERIEHEHNERGNLG